MASTVLRVTALLGVSFLLSGSPLLAGADGDEIELPEIVIEVPDPEPEREPEPRVPEPRVPEPRVPEPRVVFLLVAWL